MPIDILLWNAALVKALGALGVRDPLDLKYVKAEDVVAGTSGDVDVVTARKWL